MKKAWRISHVVKLFLAFVVTLWLLVMVYLTVNLYQSGSGDTSGPQTNSELARMLEELKELQKKNDELKKLAEELSALQKSIDAELPSDNSTSHIIAPSAVRKSIGADLPSYNSTSHIIAPSHRKQERDQRIWKPGTNHEVARRKVISDVVELWNFLRSKLRQMVSAVESGRAARVATAVSLIDAVLDDGADIHRTILGDLQDLYTASNVARWRDREAEELSSLVQTRLHLLQNPSSDCDNSPLLVCAMNKGCGYGCQIHHLVYCFAVAYGSGRTMLIDSKSWRYAPGGWEKYFQPASAKCPPTGLEKSRMWSALTDQAHSILLPIIDVINPRPAYLPQSIPSSLSDRLIRLHGHPFAWWAGQLLHYLLRPQASLLADINKTEKKLGFRGPIVGVQVRRTDKIEKEAFYHGLDEYMKHVEDYFDLLVMKDPSIKRRIYLATDEPEVLEEAKNKYLQYEVIYDEEFARTADQSSRYSETSLRAIILDIHFLSRCDYLVCTFSSGVCRVAYEMMQTRFPDAAHRFKSLDDIYYFEGQHDHSQVAVEKYLAKIPEEIDLEPGDYIHIAGNHWNGFSKGRNQRTSESGFYPSYKAKDVIRTAAFEFDEQPQPR